MASAEAPPPVATSPAVEAPPAAASVPAPETAAPAAAPSDTAVVADASVPSGVPEEDLLNVSLRFDGLLNVGESGFEGFALPSFRVSMFGQVAPRIRYRMSMGQAREFSSALVPELVPVEAFAVFAAGNPKKPTATFTAGLFSPSIVPWWTPDLSDLPLPDYASVHRAMLISRETGAEVSFSAIPGYLEGAVGFVNGTGIFGSQSGATRAVTAMVRTAFGAPGWRVMLGVGGYHKSLGSPSTPQYRRQMVLDAFFQLRMPRAGLTLGADYLFGKYDDAFRSLSPTGGDVFLLVDVTERVQGFARYEFMDQWWGDTPTMHRLEAGPTLRFAKGTKLFLLMVSREAAGSRDTGGEARLRLQL